MGWRPEHRRMKPKYNPQPNAEESRHEARLEQQPCYGCGRFGVSCHHTLLNFPEKRWRRDHRYQLPVCQDCHQGDNGIHGIGSEEKWLASIGKTPEQAINYMIAQWEMSIRRAA